MAASSVPGSTGACCATRGAARASPLLLSAVRACTLHLLARMCELSQASQADGPPSAQAPGAEEVEVVAGLAPPLRVQLREVLAELLATRDEPEGEPEDGPEDGPGGEADCETADGTADGPAGEPAKGEEGGIAACGGGGRGSGSVGEQPLRPADSDGRAIIGQQQRRLEASRLEQDASAWWRGCGGGEATAGGSIEAADGPRRGLPAHPPPAQPSPSTAPPLLHPLHRPEAPSTLEQPPPAPAVPPLPGLPRALPPMSVGPEGLLHPGYLRGGHLQGPLALQAAWAASAWRVCGCFPYPLARQRRPPLLQEGEAHHSAVARLEALLPLLLPASPQGQGWGIPLPEEGGRGAQMGRAPASGGAGGERSEVGGGRDGGPGSECPASASGPPPIASSASPSASPSAAPAASPAPVPSSPSASCPPASPAAALVSLLLDPPCLYLLLGFRLTAGSAASLVAPPSLRQCWAAFEQRHAPPGSASVLTTGARALTKHTHRDLRGEWWPRMSGSEAAKNEAARAALARLLGGALWLNLHQLPPFAALRYVLELRNEQGYGARWAIEGIPAAESRPEPPAGTAATGGAATADTQPEVRWEAATEHQQRTGAPAAAAPPAAAAGATAPGNCGGGGGAAVAAATAIPAAGAAGAGGAVADVGEGVGAGGGEGGAPGQRQERALQPPEPVDRPRPRVSFRGFLEPQMRGGHEAGWRHG